MAADNLKEKTLAAINFRDYYGKETGHTLEKEKEIICCVFHDDKKPSLSLNLGNGTFKCHSASCGKSGSVFDFHMERHGCDFKTALNELAEFAGIDTRSDAAAKKTAKMETLYNRHCTGIPLPTEASDYLEGRGLVKETTIRHLVNSRLVGFKADAWCRQFQSKIPAIIFPLFDASGQELVGIQKIFYKENIDKEYEAGTAARRAFFFPDKKPLTGRKCVPTESAIDALSVWQCVDREKYAAVSVMSSSTATKAKYLKSADEIILAMDNDQAGNVARDKAGKAIGKCRSVCWTEDDPKDMNDLLKTGKEDRIRELVENAEEFEAPKPDLTETAGCDPDKPTINPGKMQLPGTLAETWAAIEKYNEPPKIFRTEVGSIVTVAPEETYGTKAIDKVLMREYLAEAANWTKTIYGNEMPDIPPSTVVDSVMAHPEKFPLLKKVVNAPCYAESGKLHTAPGYDPETCFWLLEEQKIDLTQLDTGKACEKILDMLTDFPFADDSSRANAVAAVILPFVREMMGEAPQPNVLITAPTPATGKSLLGTVMVRPFLGKQNPALMAEWTEEPELEKTVLGEFMDGTPPVLFWDNIKRPLRSSKLAMWGTTYWAKTRKLGANKNIRFPVGAALRILTANNPELDRDTVRRSLHIRLDSRLESPEDRKTTEFKHPEIYKWIDSHRQELIQAVVTLVENWKSNGRPAPEKIPAMGSYESYRKIIGGILENAGIEGFGENQKKLMDDSDSESHAIKALFNVWIGKGALSLRAKDILTLVDEHEIGIPVDAKTDAGRTRKLAQYLKKHKGRIYNLDKGRCELKSSAKRDALMWSLEVYHDDTTMIPPEKTELFQEEVVKVVKVVEKPEEEKEKKNTNTHTHDDAHAYPRTHTYNKGEKLPPLPPLPQDIGIYDKKILKNTVNPVVSGEVSSPEETCGDCEDENIIWDGPSPVCAATGLQIEGGFAYAHCPKLKNKQKDKEDAC